MSVLTREGFSESFLGGLEVKKANLSRSSDDLTNDGPQLPVPVPSLEEANIVTSLSRGDEPTHALFLDIDLPHEYIPSSTPGHGHLAIDAKLTHDQWEKLMDALGDAGVIEEGYVNASKFRGYAALRLPWVKKESIEEEV